MTFQIWESKWFNQYSLFRMEGNSFVCIDTYDSDGCYWFWSRFGPYEYNPYAGNNFVCEFSAENFMQARAIAVVRINMLS